MFASRYSYEAITDLQHCMMAIRFYGPGICATQLRRHIDNLGQVIGAQDRDLLRALCQQAEQDIQEFSDGLQKAVRSSADTFEATLGEE